jgi:carbonic anhydrase
MVVHPVHQSKAGKLGVVTVMMEARKEQGLIRILWPHLPLEQNKPVSR